MLSSQEQEDYRDDFHPGPELPAPQAILVIVLGILSVLSLPLALAICPIFLTFGLCLIANALANHNLDGIRDGKLANVNVGMLKAGKIMSLFSFDAIVIGVLIFMAYCLSELVKW